MKKVVAETLISQLVEQLKKMALSIRWSETGCLLIAATEEPALEREMARALRERIEPEFKVLEFTFSAQPSEHLRLAYILTAVSPPAPKSALFLFGLDDLAPEDRKTAIAALNGGRGFLSRTGYSVVLWVRPATIGDLMFKAPDFYSWRTGAHTFELPADATRRAQTLAALGLYAPVNLEELRQRYLNYVIESYRWLDFRGLLQVRNIVRLPLTELFVPLSATTRVKERTIPKEFAKEEEKGGKTERERKAVAEIETLPFELREIEKRIELQVALKEHSRLVVLGEPGSGKSTLLKFLALTFSESVAAVNSRLQLHEERLPVLIPISAYAEARREQKSALMLEEFISRYFSDRSLPNLAPLFSKETENGHTLLLFDGLDEVLTLEERREMAREIQALTNHYPQSRVIVTSRIAGYDVAPLSGDFAHVTIAEFGPKEIESYAQKWSFAYERAGMPEAAYLSPEAQTRAELRTKNLVQAIKGNASVERLAKNPLLLTIIALIHQQGTRLPQRRVELYRLCIEALAETWNLARTPERPMELWLGERRLDERQIVRILAPVALWMHEHKPSGLISREELAKLIARHFKEKEGKTAREAKKLADDFITLMQQAAGLLVERGQDQFGFLHLTFQEYLAARYLAERKNRWELIRPHLHQARWLEVILLTAGILFEDDSTDLVRQILETKDEYDDLLHRNLFLAARCLVDDVPVDFQLRRRIVDELIQVWRTARFVKLREEVTNALVSLNGTASAAQVAAALVTALRDEDVGVRVHAAIALGKLDVVSPEVVTSLEAALHNKEWLVRLCSAEALGRLGAASEEVMAALLATLHNEHAEVRWSGVAALGLLGAASKKVVTAIVATLRDENLHVRSNAAEALGKLGAANEQVVTALLIALRDENLHVRSSAAEALGKLGMASKPVVTALLSTFSDEEWFVRSVAEEALGKLGAVREEVVTALVAALHDKDIDVRFRAAETLGKLGAVDEEVMKVLVTALHDEEKVIQLRAAVALGELGVVSEEVTKVLMMTLRDEEKTVRLAAAGALGQLGAANEQVIMALLMALRDKDTDMRSSAAEALGELGIASEEIVNAVSRLLKDSSATVRGAAAYTLGKLAPPQTSLTQTLRQMCEQQENEKYVSIAERDLTVADFAYEALWAIVQRLDEQKTEN